MVRFRRQDNNFGVLLLASHLMNIGLENIPPVTLGLVLGQTAIFLDLFPQVFPSALSVCMSTYLVLEHRDFKRMILGTFFHGSDMHLYYNMISLVSKGPELERRFGSVYFAYLVAVFSGLTSATYVAIGQGLFRALDDQGYLMSCAVGFSGVLFALKVLTTEYAPPGTQYAFGVIPVPSKYIFWVELVLIQMVTPNASFVGHLAGILVGLAYTRGPLKVIMDAFLPPASPAPSRDGSPGASAGSSFSSFANLFRRRPAPAAQRFHQGPSPQYGAEARSPYNGNRRSRPSAPYQDEQDYSNQNDSYNRAGYSGYNSYTGGLDEQEQLRRAMEESQRQNWAQQSSSGSSAGSNGRLYPDLADLRSRRAQFFQ